MSFSYDNSRINLFSLLCTIFFVGFSLQYANTAALCRLEYGAHQPFSSSPL